MQNQRKWKQNERKYSEIWWKIDEFHWNLIDILLWKVEGALKLNIWVLNEQIEGNCWWNLKGNQLTSMETWWQINENQRTKYWKMNDWRWIVSYLWSYFCATSLKFKVWVVSEQVVSFWVSFRDTFWASLCFSETRLALGKTTQIHLCSGEWANWMQNGMIW